MGACASAFDAFRLATEHLGTDLYRRASIQSIWLNFIPKSEYMKGVGLINSTFTVERSEPTSDEETWNPVSTVSDGGGGNSCNTTWNDVDHGETERKYSPEAFGLRGRVICEDEFIYNFQAGRFMEAYLQQLSMRSERSIKNRYRNIYMHLVPHTVCDANNFTSPGGSLTLNANGTYTVPSRPGLDSLPAATSQLTQDRLDNIAAVLNTSGATNPDESGWIQIGPDGPLYTLLLGQEISQAIQLNNSEFRQDYRFAEPSALLKRLGATRVIKNFRHLIDLDPPRWSWSGNSYTRVNHWIMPAKSKGYGAEENPDYLSPQTAPYEGAIVLNPWVFHSELISPASMPAGLKFDALNYFGEWQLRTGGREISDDPTCYDPLKKLARHFAEYKHAPRPIFPNFGRLIIFKRCPVTSFTSVTCS